MLRRAEVTTARREDYDHYRQLGRSAYGASTALSVADDPLHRRHHAHALAPGAAPVERTMESSYALNQSAHVSSAAGSATCQISRSEKAATAYRGVALWWWRGSPPHTRLSNMAGVLFLHVALRLRCRPRGRLGRPDRREGGPHPCLARRQLRGAPTPEPQPPAPPPDCAHPHPPAPQVYQRDELKLLTESGPVSVFADRRSTTADLKSAAAAQLSISPRLALMLTPPDSTAALGDSAPISRYTTAQGGGPLTLSAMPRPLSDFAAGGARRDLDAVRVQPVGASGGRAGAALVLRGVNGGTTVAQIKQARSDTWTGLTRNACTE